MARNRDRTKLIVHFQHKRRMYIFVVGSLYMLQAADQIMLSFNKKKQWKGIILIYVCF